MRNLRYSEFLTAVDTDIMAGSELEFAPGRGVYIIRAASTVNTATLAVNGNRSPQVSSARPIVLRAGPESLSQDAPWIVPVTRGEKVTSALGGTTGTVIYTADYIGT